MKKEELLNERRKLPASDMNAILDQLESEAPGDSDMTPTLAAELDRRLEADDRNEGTYRSPAEVLARMDLIIQEARKRGAHA